MSELIDKILKGHSMKELMDCAGVSEHDAMIDEINYLKKKVEFMKEFLLPCEQTRVEYQLKIWEDEKGQR
jgi:hypothetical protein